MISAVEYLSLCEGITDLIPEIIVFIQVIIHSCKLLGKIRQCCLVSKKMPNAGECLKVNMIHKVH